MTGLIWSGHYSSRRVHSLVAARGGDTACSQISLSLGVVVDYTLQCDVGGRLLADTV